MKKNDKVITQSKKYTGGREQMSVIAGGSERKGVVFHCIFMYFHYRRKY